MTDLSKAEGIGTETTDAQMNDMSIEQLDSIIAGGDGTGESAAKTEGETAQKSDGSGVKPEAKSDEGNTRDAQSKQDASKADETPDAKHSRQLEEKEKMLQKQANELGQIRKYREWYEGMSADPAKAIEHFKSLMPKQENGEPMSKQEVADISDRILAGGDDAKKAIEEVWEAKERAKKVDDAKVEIERERIETAQIERRTEYIQKFPELETPEGIEIVKDILRENGVTDDKSLDAACNFFYRLDDKHTRPIVVEAKYRMKIRALENEKKGANDKLKSGIDKMSKLAKTSGGVNATSGNSGSDSISDPSDSDLNNMSPAELDAFISKRNK